MKHTEHSKTQLNKFSAANYEKGYEKGEYDFRKIGQEYEEMNNETGANIDGLLAPANNFPQSRSLFFWPHISDFNPHATSKASLCSRSNCRPYADTHLRYRSVRRHNHFLNQQPLERVQ